MVRKELPRGEEGKVLLSSILKELRDLGYEVQIQIGNDAFTFPVDSQLSTWIIVIPHYREQERALAHELGHIWLAANGYKIFGINAVQKLEDYLDEQDMEAVALLFNAVADVAVELVIREWGYETEQQKYMIMSLDTEREAGAVMFLYMIGRMSEEEFTSFFPEESWQYQLSSRIRRIFLLDEALELKLEAIVEVLNDFLPFGITKDLVVQFK